MRATTATKREEMTVTVSELKDLLKGLTETYFTGAKVAYTKQSFAVRPTEPLVTLTVGSVARPMNPPVKTVDGRPVAFYPASVPIQIDLFTQGKTKEIAQGYTPIAEDTAEDDMLGFLNFLNSDYCVAWCSRNDLAIVVPPTVQNLTGLINDTNYDFRAMIEVTVYFTMTAIGYTGSLSKESVIVKTDDGTPIPGYKDPVETEDGFVVPDCHDPQVSGGNVSISPTIRVTPSGGGNEQFASEEDGYFTGVEINEQKEEQPNEQ